MAIRRNNGEGSDELPRWFRLGIGLVVIGLWTISIVAEMFNAGSDDWTTPAPLHGAAVAVVMFIFSREVGRAVRDRIAGS